MSGQAPCCRPRSTCCHVDELNSIFPGKDSTIVELIWEGKYDEQGRRTAPPRIQLPFQTVETVNESAQQRQMAQPVELLQLTVAVEKVSPRPTFVCVRATGGV